MGGVLNGCNIEWMASPAPTMPTPIVHLPAQCYHRVFAGTSTEKRNRSLLIVQIFQT